LHAAQIETSSTFAFGCKTFCFLDCQNLNKDRQLFTNKRGEREKISTIAATFLISHFGNKQSVLPKT
jgi:hypothetical protein